MHFRINYFGKTSSEVGLSVAELAGLVDRALKVGLSGDVVRLVTAEVDLDLSWC